MAKKPIDPRIDEALKKCNPQKTIYALAEFVDSFQAGITNAQSAADQAIKNAEVAQKAAEEAAQNVGEAFDTARASPNSSTILMEYIRINGNEQNVALPVVNTTNAGILNANDYKFFQEYDARLRAVEGISKIYLLELPSDNPSSQQITLAYTSQWPDAPNPPLEGTIVVDPARNNLSYRWNTQSNTWYKISEVAIQQFTNTTLGTIKGSTQDGGVQANADGTGSVTGWDTLTTRVNNAESSITSLTTQVDANTEGITYNRARVIGRLHAAGGSTDGVLLSVINPDDVLVGDVIIPVVNSATSGVITPAMYTQWNSGGNKEYVIETFTHYADAGNADFKITLLKRDGAIDGVLGVLQLHRVSGNNTPGAKFYYTSGSGQTVPTYIDITKKFGTPFTNNEINFGTSELENSVSDPPGSYLQLANSNDTIDRNLTKIELCTPAYIGVNSKNLMDPIIIWLECRMDQATARLYTKITVKYPRGEYSFIKQ